MTQITESLLDEIRSRFAQVDQCPQQGQRIFFENAGGALTLNSVVETARDYAVSRASDIPQPGVHPHTLAQGRSLFRQYFGSTGCGWLCAGFHVPLQQHP